MYTYRTRNVGWQGLRKLKPKGLNNSKRYLQVCLSNKNGKKYMQIHRLVAQYFCDGYFDGAVVNHKDGNIHNNNYKNLEWITQKENIHKSYQSSGVGAVRNFSMFTLKDIDGNVLGIFKGRNKAIEYIINNNIKVSISMLKKYGESYGYTLTKE